MINAEYELKKLDYDKWKEVFMATATITGSFLLALWVNFSKEGINAFKYGIFNIFVAVCLAIGIAFFITWRHYSKNLYEYLNNLKRSSDK